MLKIEGSFADIKKDILARRAVCADTLKKYRILAKRTDDPILKARIDARIEILRLHKQKLDISVTRLFPVVLPKKEEPLYYNGALLMQMLDRLKRATICAARVEKDNTLVIEYRTARSQGAYRLAPSYTVYGTIFMDYKNELPKLILKPSEVTN